MPIGKIGGVARSSFIKPLIRRLETDPVQGKSFVLRGAVQQLDLGKRRFALNQDGRVFHVGWSAETKFVGTEAHSMRGLLICVRGRLKYDEWQADSIVSVR